MSRVSCVICPPALIPMPLSSDDGREGASLSTQPQHLSSSMPGQWDEGQGQPWPPVCGYLAFLLSQVHGYKGVTFQNWARTYGCCPAMYYQPTSVQEIIEVSVHLSSVPAGPAPRSPAPRSPCGPYRPNSAPEQRLGDGLARLRPPAHPSSASQVRCTILPGG